MLFRLLVVPFATLLAVAGAAVVQQDDAAAAPARLPIEVLSNRADLVSGGDALVRIRVPRGVKASQVRVRVGERRVTYAFRTRTNGRFEGLVRGLRLGRNVLTATAPGHRGQVVIVNHPSGGPVFAGPQHGPYVCQAGARDRKCNQPPTYRLLYKSTNPLKSGLQPYDKKNPPSDVATTTTDRGVRVPFIVRRENGFQARDRYTILTLFRPGRPWQPWAPQSQWNHKVFVPHGGNCDSSFTPGEPPLADFSGTFPENPALQQSYLLALSRGYTVLSTALDNTGHNCNIVTAAESLVMAKERLVERYGQIRFTIGSGCSGGSIASQAVANAYPGVYQGLVTSCSYPDAVSTAAQFADYHLLRLYFENPARWAPGVVWLPTQMADVEGHLAHLNAVAADEAFFKRITDPSHPCPGTKTTVAGNRATRYDAQTNPGGVRCTAIDLMVNQFGRRPSSSWSPPERAAGRGFARLPVGNEGVQYGLDALRKGLITPAQFVDLNAKAGGLNVDGKPTAARLRGDQVGIGRAFRTGLINEGQNLRNVAMINHGGPDPAIAHDYSHAWWMQTRLKRAQGHTRNRVMWFGAFPVMGDPRWATEGFLAMDRWLSRVERDHRRIPLAQKIVADKPADLTDRCANAPGVELVPGPDGRPLCQLPELQTRLGTPRTVAGGPQANDGNQCQLKPLVRSAYPVTFTDAQWATLRAVFPRGVCDWSKPVRGSGHRNQTWLRYADRDGRVVYGGANLPPRPSGSGTGWSSPSFLPLLNQ